jgi:hypothetical protein
MAVLKPVIGDTTRASASLFSRSSENEEDVNHASGHCKSPEMPNVALFQTLKPV